MGARIGIALALVVATLCVYLQVRDHAFVNYDDYVYLARIETGFGLEGVREAFSSHLLSNWVPLTWVLLLVDYELYGREPAGYHLTSVAIHALNTLLLFAFLLRTTGATGRSAFVAGVFALHPLHVESVAWFSERKDVLSGLFFLLALHAHASRARLATLAALTLGLLAKPMLVSLPLVLLLLDVWPLKRLGVAGRIDRLALRRACVEQLPALALCTVVSAIAIYTQDYAGSLSDTERLTVALRFANALEAFWIYVGQSFWPAGLAAFYPHPVEDVSWGRTAVYALALLAVTGAAWLGRGRLPAGLVGWTWFGVMLLPVIGLIQVGSQAHADRYVYLPQIGLSLAVTWGIAEAARRGRVDSRALTVVGIAVVAALGVAAFYQVGHWRNTIALHERAIAVTDDNFRAHNGLAAALRRAGELERSATHYAEASRIAPRSARTHIGRAEVLADLDRLDEAIAAYEAGLALAPRHVRAHINLGHTLLRVDRPEQAKTHFERALAIDDDGGLAASGSVRFLVSLREGMAEALTREGDLHGAIDQLERLLAVRPGTASAHASLSRLLARVGDLDRSREHAERAHSLRER